MLRTPARQVRGRTPTTLAAAGCSAPATSSPSWPAASLSASF